VEVDQSRFDNAIMLRDSGRLEDAILEFHAMVEEARDSNEKASLMINEVRCYANLWRLTDAELILTEIDELAPNDIGVRINVDYGAACVTEQRAQYEKALLRYEGILQEYVQFLRAPEYRHIYEDTQQRKAVVLVYFGRYGEALPILKEATSFSTLTVEGRQKVHLYLGICYSEVHEVRLAKEELLRTIAFALKNDNEADARYRAASLYVQDGAFAQAKLQFESILETHPGGILNVTPKYIYEQLSRICHYLGEKDAAKRYAKLAQASPLQ
jgi:tetratricopeptide (TPR) repeat protein